MDIEIIGINTCGTYPSWVDHGVATIYNHVDKIVVINAGYDIEHPELGALFPLQRDHDNLKKIDIHNKIIEVTPTKEKIDSLFSRLCARDKDEFGRATNITLATQVAHEIPTSGKKRYILKFDSDQIFQNLTRKQLEDVINSHPNVGGFRFAQYADYLHDLDHTTGSVPDEFTNDGALLYVDLPDQRYGGQGSPNIGTDQFPIYSIRTFHMRRINPPGIDPYEYHFKRFWYHLYAPNSIKELSYNRETGKQYTNEQIIDMAHKEAIAMVRNKGALISSLAKDERVPYEKPKVCILTPIEYVKQGY